MKPTDTKAAMSRSAIHDPMREARPWGRWKILDQGPGYKIKLIEVLPAHRLSLQYHQHRSEHWIVIAGRARVVIGTQTRELGIMESVQIPQLTIHRIENPFPHNLQILEVQRGELLQEDDIVRLEDDYHRAQRQGANHS